MATNRSHRAASPAGGLNVTEGPGESGASARARWLGELRDALNEAQLLLAQLGVSPGDNHQAMDLYARIEGAIDSVQSLRRRRTSASGGVSTPNWINSVPWQLGRDRSA